ncbi:hypothetical protein R3P38DRAFT_3239603 [Favolaschia claudopus]|uniref:KOW domain-containing protein n=1 Tax=Favolaschia claudopus TaxID=2862362 RepID=A0AAV9Z7B7_9AGAR
MSNGMLILGSVTYRLASSENTLWVATNDRFRLHCLTLASSEENEEEELIDVERINRSQYAASFPVVCDADSEGDDVRRLLNERKEDQRDSEVDCSVAVLNQRAVENWSSDLGGHELGVPTLAWVRVIRGKRAGSLSFRVDEHIVVHIDRAGHVIQLHENARCVDILSSAYSDQLVYDSLLSHCAFEDFLPYVRSSLPVLLTYASSGPAPRVDAGDRVVVVNGRYKGHSGYVVRCLDALVDGETVTLAKIIPSVDGLYNPDNDAPAIFSKLSNLRRHGLDFSYRLRVNNRVKYAGREWYIRGLNASQTTADLVGDQAIVEKVPIEEVARLWKQGDAVRVRWGPFASRIGFVTGVGCDGVLRLLDPHRYAPDSFPLWASNASFVVRASDVDADERDPVVGSGISAMDPYVLQRLHMRDRGTTYHGLLIQVVGPGVLKGFRGTIVGDHDGFLRAERLERAKALGEKAWNSCRLNHHGILLTVRKELTLELVQDIPIEDVIHDWSGIPLLEARFLPSEMLHGRAPPPTPSNFRGSFPVLPPRPRSATPPPPNADDDACGVCSGETDGSWLDSPSLVGKKLDVQIVGLTSHPKRLSAKSLKAEGSYGHVLLTASTPKDNIMVHGVGRTSTMHSIPKSCVRPRRVTDTGQYLTNAIGRVVILGPDVDGSTSKIGLYALTLGEGHNPSGSDIAAVRFEQNSEPSFFAVRYICMSRNVYIKTTEGDYDTTEFI